ncbi:MAG: MarR family winged helix-turn-helix transcriptional regulator [Gulosibacter sp.]|uniref:MarR family winged helix-turn-helix transcriptional regulator n=1 Tax=Gulosibacter sp. TaxID=2817531 RepID=UPI003F8ED445
MADSSKTQETRGPAAAREFPTSLLMFIAFRSAENRIVDAVKGAGFDVTLAQSRLLARIAPEGTRISELAEQAQITKQTATALVDRLESVGYVERVPDPEDGRARVVRLTDRALAEIAPIAIAEEERIEAEWREHLGEEEMRRLRSLLEQLREITDPYKK